MEDIKRTKSAANRLHTLTEMLLMFGLCAGIYGVVQAIVAACAALEFYNLWYLGLVSAFLYLVLVAAIMMILSCRKKGFYLFCITRVILTITNVVFLSGIVSNEISLEIIRGVASIVLLLLLLLLKKNGKTGYQILKLR